jgi:hypothetical protein
MLFFTAMIDKTILFVAVVSTIIDFVTNQCGTDALVQTCVCALEFIGTEMTIMARSMDLSPYN